MHTCTRMEANTLMNNNGSEHTHEQEWNEQANTHMRTHEQEWIRTYTCTHYSKNGSERTRTHTITKMEANTHMDTLEQEWK